MDWHKLQRKLFEMDPVDPRVELDKLKQIAQPSNSAVTNADSLKENAEVEMPVSQDCSLNDFATLAGIKLSENKQKHGDYAHGKGPMPKAKAGRTRHPLKNKLVGEQQVDEKPLGAVAQAAKSGFASGRQKGFRPDWAQNKIQGMLNPDVDDDPQPKQRKKQKIQPARMSRMIPVDQPQLLISALRKHQQGQLPTRREIETLAQAFTKLLDMDPRQTTRVMNTLKQMQTTQPAAEQESIKERLYRQLNQKSK